LIFTTPMKRPKKIEQKKDSKMSPKLESIKKRK